MCLSLTSVDEKVKQSASCTQRELTWSVGRKLKLHLTLTCNRAECRMQSIFTSVYEVHSYSPLVGLGLN